MVPAAYDTSDCDTRRYGEFCHIYCQPGYVSAVDGSDRGFFYYECVNEIENGEAVQILKVRNGTK